MATPTPFDSARTAGLDSLVSIALVDAAGVAAVPISMEWRLLDEADQQVLDWTPLTFDPGAPPASADITVPGAANTLTAGEIFGMRTVELRLTHAGGVNELTSTYALESVRKLIPMVNSYGTMQQVQITAMYAPQSDADHLMGASEDDRIRALLGSYLAIERLPLMVVSDKGVEMGWLSEMDAATRAAKVEPQMRSALLKAQILDAAYTLSLPADAVMQARMKGLVSMTVGESSQYFGNSRPPDLAIGKESMRLLARYLRRTVRIGRA